MEEFVATCLQHPQLRYATYTPSAHLANKIEVKFMGIHVALVGTRGEAWILSSYNDNDDASPRVCLSIQSLLWALEQLMPWKNLMSERRKIMGKIMRVEQFLANYPNTARNSNVKWEAAEDGVRCVQVGPIMLGIIRFQAISAAYNTILARQAAVNNLPQPIAEEIVPEVVSGMRLDKVEHEALEYLIAGQIIQKDYLAPYRAELEEFDADVAEIQTRWPRAAALIPPDSTARHTIMRLQKIHYVRVAADYVSYEKIEEWIS